MLSFKYFETICLFSYTYWRISLSHSSPLLKAAIAAWIANVFGSAISSVLIALQTLCLKNLLGTHIAEVCKPAILKHFVGAIAIIDISLHSSLTLWKGMYFLSGSVISQCISSDKTITLYLWHKLPILANSSLLQIFPIGLCGLHKIIIVVWPKDNFSSKST